MSATDLVIPRTCNCASDSTRLNRLRADGELVRRDEVIGEITDGHEVRPFVATVDGVLFWRAGEASRVGRNQHIAAISTPGNVACRFKLLRFLPKSDDLQYDPFTPSQSACATMPISRGERKQPGFHGPMKTDSRRLEVAGAVCFAAVLTAAGGLVYYWALGGWAAPLVSGLALFSVCATLLAGKEEISGPA